jgi:cytosine/adenosine deaminase-related metal-dependent hydrolase
MLLIENGKVITRDPARPFIEDGAVAVEGRLIVDAGETAAIRAKYAGAEHIDYIDARGRLVMPGFINAHMHYYSTFARGMNLGGKPATTFGEILSGLCGGWTRS